MAEIIKAGGGYAFAVKRFSQDDGSELNPEIEAIDIKTLENRKAEIRAEISAIEAIIKEIKTLA